MTSSHDIPSAQIPRPPTRRFASVRTIVALVLREMATTYGRSPGGYIWAVLEPAGGIALMSLIFSLAFRTPALGVSFPIFYATGLVPFMFFTNISQKVSSSLLFSKQLLAYPTVTFIDAILARFILNVITQLLVGYVIFVGIIMIFDTRVMPDLATIAQTYALVTLMTLGIGVLNCFLMSRFSVWKSAWSILTRPLFIISCIFFLFEGVPQPYRDWLWYNPLVHIVGLMRRGFYPSYDATYVSVPYVAGVGMITLVIGLLLLRRYHRDLLNSV
ncbi:capsular polysaccharide transport system permease protein [Salinihabitans flavidus]|uniref:Transport permease protein n=1 Tax=Salinihabitans flavidus TaxID=569882 RepID=A0A1H8V0Y4_9RHOB|nr:ABC transporter permease [Salinihabitans flavidus]SEP09069.1 capsular polysaccharide transport system permease protein [Salinihabitans flavidus]